MAVISRTPGFVTWHDIHNIPKSAGRKKRKKKEKFKVYPTTLPPFPVPKPFSYRTPDQDRRGLRDLHHHRPSDNDIVRKLAGGRASRSEVDVHNSSKVGRDGTSGAGSEGGEGSAAGRTAGGERAEGGRGSGIGLKVQRGPGRDSTGSTAAGHGQGRESGDDQVAPLGAALDEGGGEREHLLGAERGVERLRGRGRLGGDAQDGVVAGLDGEDGGGGAEDALVGDERAGAEVGGDADALEHERGGDHAGRVGEAEVVHARLHGLDARLGDGALEEADVGGFAGADADEVGQLLRRQAEGLEVGLGELGEALLVEGGFEPF